MKGSKKFVAILIFSIVLGSLPLYSYTVMYKEEFYRLFHTHFQQYPEDIIENIYWLEQADKADFCNPKFALANIENEVQWEKYRYLFNMHIKLKLIEQHMRLGARYDRQKSYFYEEPWKKEILENLDTAETCYKTALLYWQDAKDYADKANDKKFYFINLKEITNWQDEMYRIENGKLNYEKMIKRELKRLQKVRNEYEQMDENTY